MAPVPVSRESHPLDEIDEAVRHEGPVALGMAFRRRQVIDARLRVARLHRPAELVPPRQWLWQVLAIAASSLSSPA
jgi:hypothetical protein